MCSIWFGLNKTLITSKKSNFQTYWRHSLVPKARRTCCLYSSIVSRLYFWSWDSKWPPSILMHSSSLGLTSLTALLTSSSSRDSTKSLKLDRPGFLESFNHTIEVFPCGELPGKMFNSLLLCIAPPDFVDILQLAPPFHNLHRILCWELGPWRHLKWHLNMTNGLKSLTPNLYKPPVSRISW